MQPVRHRRSRSPSSYKHCYSTSHSPQKFATVGDGIWGANVLPISNLCRWCSSWFRSTNSRKSSRLILTEPLTFDSVQSVRSGEEKACRWMRGEARRSWLIDAAQSDARLNFCWFCGWRQGPRSTLPWSWQAVDIHTPMCLPTSLLDKIRSNDIRPAVHIYQLFHLGCPFHDTFHGFLRMIQ